MKIVGEIRLKESPAAELPAKSYPVGSVESRILARELLNHRKEPQARHIIRFVASEPSDFPDLPVPQPAATVRSMRDSENEPIPEEPHAAPALPEPATLLQQVVVETEEQRQARRRAHGYIEEPDLEPRQGWGNFSGTKWMGME